MFPRSPEQYIPETSGGRLFFFFKFSTNVLLASNVNAQGHRDFTSVRLVEAASQKPLQGILCRYISSPGLKDESIIGQRSEWFKSITHQLWQTLHTLKETKLYGDDILKPKGQRRHNVSLLEQEIMIIFPATWLVILICAWNSVCGCIGMRLCVCVCVCGGGGRGSLFILCFLYPVPVTPCYFYLNKTTAALISVFLILCVCVCVCVAAYYHVNNKDFIIVRLYWKPFSLCVCVCVCVDLNTLMELCVY